ncbi:16S rRNA (guanine(527)-N(7))-methyltransferase RsmG [Candidatus Latescibacterota bacterium]
MPIPESFGATILSGAGAYGISLDDTAISRFETYYEVLSEYNFRTNLVSKGDMKRFPEYHILDSLKIASCHDMSGVGRMMDFGSGAGLPGIPLAIAFPHIEMYLVDSRKKRCEFLSAAVERIPLSNAHVLQRRAEILSEDHDRSFDCVVTRATVSLEAFFRCARRFITAGGSLVSIKGDDIENELTALKKAVDPKLININVSSPKEVNNVRNGYIVTISLL